MVSGYPVFTEGEIIWWTESHGLRCRSAMAATGLSKDPSYLSIVSFAAARSIFLKRSCPRIGYNYPMPAQKDCLIISIEGIVQGVGFRPFIYNLAHEMRIRGYVSNTSDGVVIAAEGDNLALFIERIGKEAPPLAKIVSIGIAPAEPCTFTEFSIKKSDDVGSFTLLSPDISVCDNCLKELLDSHDRRFLYPFINCTNCGPRYTITRTVPYDRKNTTMHAFTLCHTCSSEYHDPHDRRFHAQPNACSQCGPAVSLLDRGGKTIAAEDPVAETISMLKQGKILAIKGLGGFHIACDATHAEAVRLLRERKRRSNKPFALMAPDIATMQQFCEVTGEEEKILSDRRRPIVLLRKRSKVGRLNPAGKELPEDLAPDNRYLGFMLPYTPLHYLLFHHPFVRHRFDALVMTSGNTSEEPIIIRHDEAVEKLSPMVDAFLVHDRDIFMRVDDSVVTVRSQGPGGETKSDRVLRPQPDSSLSFIRRSRGYAPEPVQLSDDGPEVLGCGADMKNTFAITRGRYAIVSQHIGDMEHYETIRFFEETLENLKTVYRAAPEAIAYDLHPRYFSSQWALEHGKKQGLKMFPLQHHYAHIGSVMAEHGLKEKVIGVAFDGTGYGDDGTLWGGEFLIADIKGFVRAGHLKPVPLPGAEMAVKEPWRVALSYLKEASGEDLVTRLLPAEFLERHGEQKIRDILMLAGHRDFSPLSSGAGRLFDAVSALLGICSRNTFEGEASIALESFAREGIEEAYPADIHARDRISIDFSHTILAIIDDMKRGLDRGIIAAKFHNTIVQTVMRVVLKLSMVNNIRQTALCGGVFQNAYLSERIRKGLKEEGIQVYEHFMVPCNDAGISLGQAYIARERIKAGIA